MDENLSQGKVDNTNFTVSEKDGQETFICNICQKETKTAKSVKAHITSKHRERPVDSEDDDPTNKRCKDKDGNEEDNEVAEEELDEWLRKAQDADGNRAASQPATENSPSSRPQPEPESVAEDRMVIDTSSGMEGSFRQAVERIQFLETELKSQEDLIKSMETKMETKNDLMNIANSKVEELESKLEEKESMITKFNTTFTFMKKEITKLKEENGGGTNQEIAKKLKKANDDLKNKTKLVEEVEKAKEELNMKVGKEMSLRAKAEGDAQMLQNCVKALQSVVDRQNSKETTREKSKERCNFIGKSGGCKKGSKCAFWHPEGEELKDGKPDCTFWMTGYCKYGELFSIFTVCNKKHDPIKKGSKSKNKTKDETPGFAESLAQVLSQANPTEAQRSPAQGLDHHNILSLLQGALQPINQQMPPPPFPSPASIFLSGGRTMTGQQTPTFHQTGSSNDPAQLLLQALQLAQARR